jgi:hypothetical protein
MTKRRLTKQRWDALNSAMAYYERIIEEGEFGECGIVDPKWKVERRHHESAMEWLWSIQPKDGAK